MYGLNIENPYLKLSIQYFGEDVVKNGIYFNGNNLMDYVSKVELDFKKEYCLDFIFKVKKLHSENAYQLALSCNEEELSEDGIKVNRYYFTCIPNLETFFIYSDLSFRESLENTQVKAVTSN